MRLNRVLADEQFFRNLPIAQTIRNQLQDFEFSSRHPQLAQFTFIKCKGRRNGDFLEYEYLFFAGEFEPQPDSQAGK